MVRKLKVVDVVTPVDQQKREIEQSVVCEVVPENKQTDIVEDEKPVETDKVIEDDKICLEAQDDKIVKETQTLKVRTNQLHECVKCKKMMTLKTLRYSHEKTCGITKDSKVKSPENVQKKRNPKRK